MQIASTFNAMARARIAENTRQWLGDMTSPTLPAPLNITIDSSSSSESDDDDEDEGEGDEDGNGDGNGNTGDDNGAGAGQDIENVGSTARNEQGN